MREELFWDRNSDRASPEVVIERAINFGGLDFIEEVQEKYGMETFIQVLIHHRNLSRKAVNYWCLRLGLDRNSTRAFQDNRIWEPVR
jgi:hypothetical protein